MQIFADRLDVRNREESKMAPSCLAWGIKNGFAINECAEDQRKNRIGKDQQFGSSHIKFEMIIRYPNRDVV